ncbi:Nn.00g101310.m01.CDS01 [Neocucurbitaria sp. VM-36]
MCSYEPVEPEKKKRKTASVESATINSAQGTTVTTPMPKTTTPIPAANNQDGESTFASTNQFVGTSSVPGFIMEGLSPADKEGLGISHKDLRNLLLPALGLQRSVDASSTKSAEATSAELRVMEALPRSPEVISLFQQYKQVVYPLNPHPLDLTAFESDLVKFLSSTEQVKSGQTAAPSLPWLAILLAVLATGLQFSNLPLDERISRSKCYVRESFACLHAETGFITASVSTITAILILVTALQNNLATEAAWSYLGLASRLAQSLGLHTKLTSDESLHDSSESSLWKAIVWQDCLLSLCFGRQPCTSLVKGGLNSSTDTQEINLEYRQAMYLLAATSVDFIEKEFASPFQIPSPAQLSLQASRVQCIIDKTKPELRSRDSCRSIEDHVEHLAMRLNMSFAVATFLRPSLENKDYWQAFPDEKRELRRMCIDSCATAVESFIGLHRLSVVAERSWAILHNGLSCALILLLVDEARNNEKIKQLQQQLVCIMPQSSAGQDQGSLLWGPHARILSAVKLLDSARSTRPPASSVLNTLPVEQEPMLPSSTSNLGLFDTYGEGVDRGNGFHDFNDINTFSDLPGLDLDQYSLNTLYDSIVWGNYQTT